LLPTNSLLSLLLSLSLLVSVVFPTRVSTVVIEGSCWRTFSHRYSSRHGAFVICRPGQHRPAVALAITTRPRTIIAIAQNTISLAPQANPGNSASDFLSPSYAGFGIEPSNLFSFTGGAEENKLSVKLLQNLADYSGAPPHIRLGGNTQDYMLFEKDYTDLAWKKNPSSTAQGNIAADSMIIGPGYFEALNRFPKDTPVTFGLNMAYMEDDWEDRIVAAAQGAVSGMTNVKLYSFEVGNEPDLWLQNTFRTAPWDGKTYTTQFLDRAETVYTRVLKPAGLPSSFFEPPATASTIGTTFEISQLVTDGMMEGRNGDNYVTVWNQHDYFYCKSPAIQPLCRGMYANIAQSLVLLLPLSRLTTSCNSTRLTPNSHTGRSRSRSASRPACLTSFVK
jgi:hypothetical protein